MIGRVGTGPIALVHGAALDVGGLGAQVRNAVDGLSAGVRPVVTIGPGPERRERPRPGSRHVALAEPVPAWLRRYSPYRWLTGALQARRDGLLGAAAARELAALGPALCYAFTQVAAETLAWAREARVPAILESPNGHLRAFAEVYRDEARRWLGARWPGHPSEAMVRRVEREYELADRIRVSSEWSRRSLVAAGVAPGKIDVLQQAIDLRRWSPPAEPRRPGRGPLRLVFVGSLDLRKGFPYLLEALRRLGPGRCELQVVGATGDRASRRIWQERSRGIAARVAPGDPTAALHRAELFVLPTLEDGSPFAVAEAMATALPVVVPTSCGAAEWVRPGATGFVVEPRSVDSLAAALEAAARDREALVEMGAAARRDAEARAAPAACAAAVGRWIDALGGAERSAPGGQAPG
jgi:glycosyltransferase involved in cell wall biosynthesis